MVQGGQTIDVQYLADKVVIDMAGKQTEVSSKGVVLDMAPGFENIVAKMMVPEEGVVVSAVDFNSLKGKTLEVKNDGEETIDGVLYKKTSLTDYYAAADKTVIWSNATTGEVLKVEQIVPAMNNAVVTTSRSK
jgi:hypothetical protein